MEKLAWHFDFHSHKQIRINHDPDVRTMASELAAAGVEEIITFAKCHTGFAYYPSAVGTSHPRMRGDALGDVVRACKDKGIRVLAYISFGIDGEAGRRHPEWAQIADPDQGPQITPDHFVSICPYTPYIEALMLPMVQEIVDGYPVDGFFFDTMGAMGICHCPCCQEEFRSLHGREIPRDASDPDWGAYGSFRRERAWRVVGRVGRYITDQKPEFKVGFNWVGTSRYPEAMPAGVTCLTCDFPTTGPQSLQASYHSAYGKTADRPCDVMFTVINRGWADWAPRQLPGLEQTAATVWAHGCRPYLGDRLHPTNRLDPLSVRALRFMGQVQSRVAAVAPPPEAKPVDEVVVLISPHGVYGADMRRFAADRSASASSEGMHRLLLDSGLPVALVAEDFLGPHLDDTRVIILPETEAISADAADRLRGFVETGGQLLISGRLPLVDGSPLAWAGIQRADKPWQDHVYLCRWRADTDSLPVLVHGDFHKVRPASGTQTVMEAIQPYDCSHGMRFGHATGPASFQTSGLPALTRCKVGSGAVWYLEANIGTCYHAVANFEQVAWFRRLLERLLPRPLVRVLSPAGNVEAVPYCTANATWVYLINHGGEQLCRATGTSRVFEWVPPYPVTLELKIAPGRSVARAVCAGEPLDFQTVDGTLRVPVVMDQIWRVIEVHWD